MNFTSFDILEYSSIISVLIPLLTWIIRNKVFTKQMNALFLYLIGSMSADIFSFFFFNQNVLIAYTFFECLIISYLFWLELEKKNLRRMVVISAIAFLITSLCCIILLDDFNLIDSVLTSLEFVIIICFCILYFFKEFYDLNKPRLTDYWFFWLNSSFLLYFGSSLFIFLFKSYFWGLSPTILNFLWSIHLIANITNNSLISVAICKVKKT